MSGECSVGCSRVQIRQRVIAGSAFEGQISLVGAAPYIASDFIGSRLPMPFGVFMVVQVPFGTSFHALP